MLPKEKLSGEQKCVKVLKDSKQILVGKDRLFAFDYVISPLEKQVKIASSLTNIRPVFDLGFVLLLQYSLTETLLALVYIACSNVSVFYMHLLNTLHLAINF